MAVLLAARGLRGGADRKVSVAGSDQGGEGGGVNAAGVEGLQNPPDLHARPPLPLCAPQQSGWSAAPPPRSGQCCCPGTSAPLQCVSAPPASVLSFPDRSGQPRDASLGSGHAASVMRAECVDSRLSAVAVAAGAAGSPGSRPLPGSVAQACSSGDSRLTARVAMVTRPPGAPRTSSSRSGSAPSSAAGGPAPKDATSAACPSHRSSHTCAHPRGAGPLQRSSTRGCCVCSDGKIASRQARTGCRTVTLASYTPQHCGSHSPLYQSSM